MSNKYSHFDATVLDRLKKALNLQSDSQLADYLEVMPTVIANWRSRGRVNTTRVLSKCESLDVHWILFGTKRIRSGSQSSRFYEEHDDMMEKSPMQKSLVQEEYEQLEEQNKKLEQENMQLKSKIEVLQDVIVRLKKDPDNS